MSRNNSKSTKPSPSKAIPPPFAAVPANEINSSNFHRLTHASVLALVLLRCESGYWKREDYFCLTYDNVMSFMTRKTWHAGIKQLCQEGFIDIKKSCEDRKRFTNLYNPYSERWKIGGKGMAESKIGCKK